MAAKTIQVGFHQLSLRPIRAMNSKLTTDSYVSIKLSYVNIAKNFKYRSLTQMELVNKVYSMVRQGALTM